MTVQQLLEVLQNAGWRVTKTETACHSLVGETLRKTVTISGRLELTVPPAVLRTILRHAQIQE